MTKSKNMQESKMQPQDARISLMVDSAPVGFLCLDSKGLVVSINRAIERWFSLENEDIVGCDLSVLNEDFARTVLGCLSYLSLGQDSVCEYVHDFQDREIVFKIQARPFEVKKGEQGTFLYIEDISELRDLAKKENYANQLKSQFLANMSHELRTPMNGVLGMSSHLLNTSIDVEHKESISIIKQSAEALLELINDILDYSKIEAGRIEIEVLPFNLRHLVKEVVELLAFKMREKNLRFIVDIPDDLPEVVMGDTTRIRQIIFNLIGNAVKFTEVGHITLRVEANDLDASQHDLFTQKVKMLSFAVQDSGIGIPQDKHQYVFNMFNQADSSTTRKYGGTGLGLSICRQLAEIMQGSISLNSEVGKGSTFTLHVPCEVVEEASVKVDAKPFRGKKIVVINWSEAENALIERWLKDSGAQVTFLDAEDSQNWQDKTIINADLLLVDDVCISFVAQYDVPKILMGDLEDGEEMVDLIERGIDAHLDRPLFSKTLFGAMDRVLNPLEDEELSDDEVLALLRTRASEEDKARDTLLFLGKHILVAEDNRINQAVIKKILEKFGCEVSLAADGQEAIDYIERVKFDAILMDCQMPNMDGFEATNMIRLMQNQGRIQRMPIIAVTANASDNDRKRCLDGGMDDYLSKPITEDQLAEVMTKWLQVEQGNFVI